MELGSISDIISSVATVASILIAYLTVKESKKSSGFSIVDACNNKDMNLGELRDKAIKENDCELYKKYCKRKIWLHWIQYNYCIEGLIPAKILFKWVKFNFKSFNNEKFDEALSFESVWKELKCNSKYSDDKDFCSYLDSIFNMNETVIKRILKLS